MFGFSQRCCESTISDYDSFKVNGRIAFIDCLRGFTMLLVIWNHVADMSFGLGFSDSFLTQVFVSFRMPMFFFISGFIAWKSVDYFSSSRVRSLVIKKARVQLIPTIVFWFLGVLLIKGISIYDVPEIFTGWFPGYWWFTETLFLMFLLYYSAAYIANKTKINVEFLILTFEALFLLAFLNVFRNSSIAMHIGMEGLSRNFMYFVFGLYISKNKERFYSLLSNTTFMTICIVIVCLITYILYGAHLTLSHNVTAFLRSCTGYPFICIIFALFRNSAEYWASDSRISVYLRFIGRRTLDLYVLHFFFLPDMKYLTEYLAGAVQTVPQICMVSVVTIIVAVMCLATSHVIRLSPFLAKYLFGCATPPPQKNGLTKLYEIGNSLLRNTLLLDILVESDEKNSGFSWRIC